MSLDERDAVRALLRASALPVDDLDTSPIDFTVAVDDAAIVAVAGLETHADTGLLRSLAVHPSLRGTGLGGRLVDAMESQAQARQLRQLVLLTTTAAPFFAARGYAVIARDVAPKAIQHSAEFRALCPASATCMLKTIEPTP